MPKIVECKYCGVKHEKDRNRGLSCRTCFNNNQKKDYQAVKYDEWSNITPNQVTSMSWRRK